MTDPADDHVHELADLHIDTIRRENDHVDQRLEELEAEITSLESDVDQLESEKADIAEEKEAAEELLGDLREGQRKKQLNRIKEANAAVSEDNEVDLSTLEDASVEQLETVAQMVEGAAGAAGVSNTDRTPDVGGATPEGTGGDGPSDLEQRKAAVADEHGLASLYAQATEGFEVDHTDPTGAQINDGVTESSAFDAATGGEQ